MESATPRDMRAEFDACYIDLDSSLESYEDTDTEELEQQLQQGGGHSNPDADFVVCDSDDEEDIIMVVFETEFTKEGNIEAFCREAKLEYDAQPCAKQSFY